jgi:hypothetical protein
MITARLQIGVLVLFVAAGVGLPGAQAAKPVAVIQSYERELSGVRAANPDVRLSIGREPSLSGERVLMVEYPAPSGDPAGRDVQCDAEARDWTGGRAISFQIKPARAVKLSVSFMDRHRVAYTAWTELQGGVWQLVRIPFAEIRPNPFFQFPDAKKAAPLDVSDVRFIAFAPQDDAAGTLTISRFVISQ